MATAAALASPSGLGLGSSITGRKLRLKPSSAVSAQRKVSLGNVVAKYGEKSIYFDLEDMDNTTGNWDLYGSDGPSPYNGLQSKFFETFAGPFTNRRLLLPFLLLGFGGAIAIAGANASGDYVPIVKGPQDPPQPGPNGKI